MLTPLEQVPLTWEKNASWWYHLRLFAVLTWGFLKDKETKGEQQAGFGKMQCI